MLGGPVEHGFLAFMGFRITSWIFTLLALFELVVDQLPSTESRTVPWQFGARLISSALCGATIGSGEGMARVWPDDTQAAAGDGRASTQDCGKRRRALVPRLMIARAAMRRARSRTWSSTR